MGGHRARRRRTAGSLAFVVLVTCLVTGLFVPAARASCPGPTMGLGPAGTTPSPDVMGMTASASVLDAAVGEGIAVRGSYFTDGCDDVMNCSAGCGGCQSANPSSPMNGVQLVLVTSAGETVLGESDADGPAGELGWDVAVPAGTPPGPAALEARHVQYQDALVRVPITITVT